MSLNATNFIQKRKNVISITYERIRLIMSYVVRCYCILHSDNPIYSRKKVASTTNYHFEDYLKMEFVENYLTRNKYLLSSDKSTLENITFHYETVKRFKDFADGVDKSDKIDVYVNKLGLKDEWAVQEEHLYLAIECKRIASLADCKDYISDIQKFCDREYKELRIPFESQIAFIENEKLTYSIVCDEVNQKLKISNTIITDQFLTSISLDNKFQGSYSSEHRKNFNQKIPFTIFHLLFDYSKMVSE